MTGMTDLEALLAEWSAWLIKQGPHFDDSGFCTPDQAVFLRDWCERYLKILEAPP